MKNVYFKRLSLICAESEINWDEQFLCPTTLAHIERYIHTIEMRSNKLLVRMADAPHPLRKSIAYRVQFLETLAAIIEGEKERSELKRRQTMHSIIERFFIHSFCVASHSVLEGFGSTLVKGAKGKSGKIGAPEWRKALAEDAVMAGARKDEVKEFKQKLEGLTKLRDRIHLDAVEDIKEGEFAAYTYNDAFLPTFEIMQLTFRNLGRGFPRHSTLSPR